MLIRSILTSPKNPRFAAFLEVDTDPNSERIQVFDRKNADLKHHQRTLGGVIKAILPLKYSINPDLMCTLLDDDNEFNGAIIDNVQCIHVELNSFNKNTPQPYEPPVA